MKRNLRTLVLLLLAVAGATSLQATYTSSTTGQSYTHIFRATTSLSYDTIGNWYTTDDNGSTWTVETGNIPNAPSSNKYNPMLLDGSLFDTSVVSKGDDGYYTVSGSSIEGWNLSLGLLNGVHLSITTLRKLQGGGTRIWYIDETSKFTIATYGVSGQSNNNTNTLYVYAPEGVVFQTAFQSTSEYSTFLLHLGLQGSILFNDGTNDLATGLGTYTISSLTIDTGYASDTKEVVSRRLIGYASTTATISAASDVAVTSSNSEITPTASSSAVTTSNDAGAYYFHTESDGYYISYVRYAEPEIPEEAVTRTLTESGTWASSGAWTTTTSSTSVPYPASGVDATLTVNGDSTLTLNRSASLGALTVNGTNTLTLASSNSNTLTTSSLAVNTPVVATGSSVSTFGSVALASSLTLDTTSASSTVVTSLTGSGNLILDGTNGAFSADDTLLTTLKAWTGTITLQGSNTVTLGYAPTVAQYEFGPHLVVADGTHAFSYGGSYANLFASGDSDDNPTIHVKGGATLNFTAKDISGWQSSLDATGVIRVDDGATLNFLPSGTATFYYRQRLVMEPGAKVDASTTFADDKFRFHGGTASEATAQIAVLVPTDDSSSTTATFSGKTIRIDSNATAGLGIAVAEGATLALTSGLSSASTDSNLAKWGSGTLLLSTDNSALTSTFTIRNGTVQATASEALGVGTVIVNGASASLDLYAESSDTSLSFAATLQATNGTIRKTGAGTVSLTGTVSGTLAVEAGTLDLTECTDFSGLSLSVASGATVRLHANDLASLTASGFVSGSILDLTSDTLSALIALGTAAISLPADLPEGVTVQYGLSGHTSETSFTSDGVTTTLSLSAAKVTGDVWWWDYEFEGNATNSGSDGTALTFESTASYPFASAPYVTASSGEQALQIATRPYRDVSAYPDAFTAVAYLTAGSTSNGVLLAFGTASGTTLSLLQSDTGVTLVRTDGSSIDKTLAVAVDDVATTNHLYAITFQLDSSGYAQILLYVDGVLKTTLDYGATWTLASGFQLGSVHGGISGFDASSLAALSTSDSSTTIEFLRVSDEALTADAIAALAEAYPYTPPSAVTRTVSVDGSWSESLWDDGASVPSSGPVNITFSEGASLTVDTSATLTKVSLSGEGTLLAGTGDLTVDSLTISSGTITLDAAALTVENLTVSEGAALLIDCTGLDFSQGAVTLAASVSTSSYSRITLAHDSGDLTQKPWAYTLTRSDSGVLTAAYTQLPIYADIEASAGDVAFEGLTWSWEGKADTAAALTYAEVPWENYTSSFTVTAVGSDTATEAPSVTFTDTVETKLLEVDAPVIFGGSGSLDVTTFSVAPSATLTLSGSPLAEDAAIRLGGGSILSFKNTATLPVDVYGNGALVTPAGASATLSGTNTYTNGTQVEESGILTLTASETLGSGTISGAGTIVAQGVLPSNTSGLTESTWTGTFTFKDQSLAALDLTTYGSVASKLAMTGTNSGTLTSATVESPLTLDGTLTLTGGTEALSLSLAELSGSGTLNATATTADALTIADGSTYQGDLAVSESSAIVLGSGSSSAGTIRIASGTSGTIASGKTWTAPSGLTVAGTLIGAGTLAGPLTILAGAILDATAPLTVTDEVTYPSEAFTITFPEGSTNREILKGTDSLTAPTEVTLTRGTESLEASLLGVKNNILQLLNTWRILRLR